MNRVLNRRLLIRNYTNYIKPSKFYMVPYKEQYESRDNENEIIRLSFGGWLEENKGNITKSDRINKLTEYLTRDQLSVFLKQR